MVLPYLYVVYCLKFSYHLTHFITANTQSNYWVLSTDYENYSIVFYCKNIDNNKSAQLAWVLSRQPELNPSVQSFVYSLLDKHFVRSEMYKSVQSAEICEPRDK